MDFLYAATQAAANQVGDFVSLTGINATPLGQSFSGGGNFGSLITDGYQAIIGLMFAAAVFMLAYSGFLRAAFSFNAAKVTKSKETGKNALIGFILVLVMVLVFGFISPAILNISVTPAAATPAPSQNNQNSPQLPVTN